VTVERVNAAEPTKYDVTIVDPTASSFGIDRAVFGTAVLNGSVTIGDTTTLAVQGNAPVKPGVNNGTIFINGTAAEGAGVTPVEIVAVDQQGTLNAVAACRLLDSDGVVVPPASGQVSSNVIPIPFRQFAASGDRGFLTTLSVGSGAFGATVTQNFVEIVKPAFFRFG
jgi:hypothetical protein